MISKTSVNGFVLAGGRSSRMAVDKARLTIGGQPLLLRAVNTLKLCLDSVTVVGDGACYDFLHEPTIPDHWPGEGPLAAILTGLEHSTSAWNIFLACDMPLVSGRLIELLIRSVTSSNSDAVVPRTHEGWQPLAAAYHARCDSLFSQALKEGRRSMIDVLDRLRVDMITQDMMVRAGLSDLEFTNVNTPEDWERLIGLLKDRDKPC